MEYPTKVISIPMEVADYPSYYWLTTSKEHPFLKDPIKNHIPWSLEFTLPSGEVLYFHTSHIGKEFPKDPIYGSQPRNQEPRLPSYFYHNLRHLPHKVITY